MNDSLAKAKIRKNDEFYTLYSDIEAELKHYDFRNKTVYCNCDNLYRSHFFRYFVLNFNLLGLKRLICTCYADFDAADIQLSFFEGSETVIRKEKPYRIEITEVRDNIILTSDVRYLLRYTDGKVKSLKGNGDFRSEECIRLMKKADVIVSNPPFSLFHEYFALLVQSGKEFLIIGNMNELFCIEIFPYFKSETVRFGCHTVKSFLTPDGSIQKFGNILWYTNMQAVFRKECIVPETEYSPEKYRYYDNFPAVNVNKLSEIPKNCPYIMGVPITYMLKHNPDLFELLGTTHEKEGLRSVRYQKPLFYKTDGTVANGGKCNTQAVLASDEKPETAYYKADNTDKYLVTVYGRILIRSKRSIYV